MLRFGAPYQYAISTGTPGTRQAGPEGLRFERGADVLEHAEKMVGVAWRKQKVEALIKGSGLVVLGVNGKCPNAGNIRGLQCAKHGVLKQSAALPRRRNRKAGQQHDRYGMTSQALDQPARRIAMLHLADHHV